MAGEGIFSADLKRYFADSRSWDEQKLREAKRSRRVAYAIGAVGAAVGIVGLGTVVALLPLKRIEVVTVRVNQNTGAVDVQTQLAGKKPVAYDEAVTKYFLANYVRDRESWNPAAAKENFDTVAILSTPIEQRRWNTFFSTRNPASPRVLWGDHAYADARITSISFINTRVANVRFTRTVQTDTAAQASDWIATVTFGYTNAPMSEGDRFRNPLGFQVHTYRSDPVVMP
ncbi:virB8 family protein [Sphingomonas sp. PAMC 26605]|uniref:virB8 family protein n=1 Tax=Sphingomonas sp. PAMC 26605 TaxID=1112214 RepID=UPI00026CD222|nr:VirB8/TrbF family protein [Sphingomonas sp. PAMC 26605]